ncbi:lytic transglycosylase domain-containing protein [Rhizobium sp. MHM7A]|uniref:lytic transglycosylase domain-containing protein n=1 Tax=Rhizobium sp. MHM7A TaxID=2583233 RepID=UPI0011068FAE|nr:lytic transglycosylase domain-containing protein [Rhizobium sp. MHM7A]TLX16508.1 lytic transglycosylase domain-containing protein [Rhizobium sp. MHM7A]
MAEAPETTKFFANGATIFSNKQNSALASFARIAGLAAVVTTVAPSGTGDVSPSNTITADIAAIDEINRIVTFKPLTETLKVDGLKVELPTTTVAKKSPPVSNGDVNAIIDAVTSDLNAGSVYHQYGDYKVPHNVLRDLARAAKDADFPTDYLFGIVEKESGFDCHAEPPSGSARGCMQVIDQTWLRLVKEYGAKYGLAEEAELVELTYNKRKQPVYKVNDREEARRILDLRYDAYYAAALAVTDLKSAKSKIEKNLSARFNDDNLYLPHFMGEDRAEAALAAYKKQPNASASKIFHREARANPGMFYDGKGRRRVPIDVADFIKRAQNVILSRSAKYHNVEQVAQKNSLDFISTGSIPVPVAKPSISKDSFVSAMKARIASRKLAVLQSDNVAASYRVLDTDLQLEDNAGPKL